MPTRDHKVRVFISSTFKDMHAERDHLVTVVFPELRERCERLGLEFFDVDLRWGVPEKTVDGETANSWEYCRQWIDRVEPFFVCMLGQRYGWEPEPHQLKDADDRARQHKQRRSITDMEVRYAVLNTQMKRHSYFYLRDAEAPATAADFVDPPPLLAKLDQLKTEVRACGRPVRDYPCTWKDNAFTEMEAFGNAVLADLWSGVLRDERYVSKDLWRQVLRTDPDTDSRYTKEEVPVPDDIAEQIIPLAKPPPKNPLEAEREQMAAFAASRLRWFQGRTKELDQLTAFIRDPAEDNRPRLALIAAVPGQGKSALMAKLSESLRHSSFDIRHFFVVTHFVGATESSSTAYALVKRLNDELDASGIAWVERPTPEGQPKEEPKLDFYSLCQRFYERLGDYAGERRIVILLDAINQLNDGHELGWLPHRLGPSVRIVVSCIDDPTSKEDSAERKVLTALTSRHPQPLRIPLGELTSDDVRIIVVEYLREYCHELDREHLDTLCAIPQARNPLYLTVMLHELRTLGGNNLNTLVPARIAAMPQDHPDTVSLFAWVLQRMEAAEGFGREAVQAWCLYLALGRVGMASRELADLLKCKLGDHAALTAQRIERGLRRYLQRRGETLDFFHGQLRQAVMERCTHSGTWPAQSPERNQEVSDTIRPTHHDIANYFRALADPLGDKTWKSENLRAFSEAAPHLIGAEQWDELNAYLSDFRCLDVRIRAGQVFEVVTDQRAALAALPELAEESKRDEERVAICARYGEALVAYARDCAAGKNPSQPVPPDARGMSEIGSASGEVSPRADRLRAIANFTGQQATWLAAHPTEFLTWAANATEDGALAEAAEAADATLGPWLHRDPRPPSPPLRPQCLRTLLGHTGSVECVCITPDGRRAVSTSGDNTGNDNTLRVWDLQNGQCLQTLFGHTSWVCSVSVTPDGRWAVSASVDATLRFWDLQSGHCIRTLKGHTYWVNSVSVTPDGRRAVSASRDKTLRVWDLQSGQCLHTLKGHTNSVESVSVTPDGRRAVSASGDETLRVWDMQSGLCLAIYKAGASVKSVAVSPFGDRIICGTEDGQMHFLTLRNFPK